MNRAPIVLAGTAAGLAGVLVVHTTSPPIASTLTGAASRPTTPIRTATTTPSKSKARSKAAAPKGRSATGEDVSYPYGDLQVRVTRRGSQITDVSLVRLDSNDPRSQGIDQSAVPQLRQEALSAQSAHIDGVSGASYTSQAYAESLQSALDKLA